MEVAAHTTMSARVSLIALVVALLVAPVAVVDARAAAAVASPHTVGRASWYGPRFHGRRTTSGEIFDQNKLTAASPTLPMGTRVVVTNLANGRRVHVRVNDRMPPTPGRVIDLSHAAARHLDSVKPGVVPVSINVVSRPDESEEGVAEPSPGAPASGVPARDRSPQFVASDTAGVDGMMR
jgi:rare lipoprotein A